MMTRLLFLGFFIGSFNFSMAQNQAPELKNVIPPSPTVSSLGKYGEIPVGLYTGTPNISIPLYEIKDGSLSVPISLSYHAAGIRVEEIASDVGLGWTLNAGGVLGRQVRGLVDEAGWIKSSQNRIGYILQSGNIGNINSMSRHLELGALDGEADLYYYNFNGRTGKFLFNEDGTLYNYPAENVSIQPIGGTNYFGAGWEVIAEDGTVYEFNASELVYTGSSCNGSSISETYTAWYLTKITSADGKSHIDFIYDQISYNIQIPLGVKRYIPVFPGGANCLPYEYSDCLSNSYYETKQLSRINFSGGYVKFEYNTAREDHNITGPKRLDKIKLYSSSINSSQQAVYQQIKEFQLGFGYFGAGSTYADGKRLKLTSITENLSTGSKPPHIFTYEENIQMPSRFSPNKDHWGYFNGANNTTGGIPTFTYQYANGTTWPVNGGANRNANASTMQACILKKITYPTGGETLFTYETNRSTDPRVAVAEFTQTPYHFNLNELWSSLSSPYDTGTFTVPAGEEVEVAFSMTGIETSGSVYNCDAFNWSLLKNGSPTQYSGIGDGLNGVTLHLAPGTYKFRFNFICEHNYQGRLNYNIVATVRVPVANNGNILRHVGGLRIQQMEDRPADGGPPVIKNYKYPVGGTLVNFPQYGYDWTVYKYEPAPFAGCYLDKTCNYISVASSTNYPLATTNGSYVGYSQVIEDLGDNGEIEHSYTVYSDLLGEFPFPPIEMSDWQRGRELQARYYTIDGNGQKVLKKDIFYNYTGFDTGNIKGYKASRKSTDVGSCSEMYMSGPFITYHVIPDFFYLSGVTERLYDQNDPSKWVETSTQYKYDPVHYQQKEVVTSVSGSDGTVKDQLVVRRKFPRDYNTASASGSEALGIKKLNDLHIVNVPIEEYSIRQKVNTTNNQVTDARIVSGAITTFKPTAPYPDKILRLEKNGAMSLANFGTGSTISNNLFMKNANATVSGSYTPAIEFNSFDDKGNLTMQRQADGTYSSYIWGYEKSHPIAKIDNATYSQVLAQVASLQSLSNADNDRTIGNVGNEGLLRTALESLRASLTNAMVTTYTYDPLIGVTSMTDPKGYTVYYEYDGFNRLEKVRDAAGKLLSTNKYHYKEL